MHLVNKIVNNKKKNSETNNQMLQHDAKKQNPMVMTPQECKTTGRDAFAFNNIAY